MNNSRGSDVFQKARKHFQLQLVQVELQSHVSLNNFLGNTNICDNSNTFIELFVIGATGRESISNLCHTRVKERDNWIHIHTPINPSL